MTEDPRTQDELTLALIAERTTITKQAVETGRVRVSTRVEEHRELVSQALHHDGVIVERVPINKIVAIAPEIRRG